MHFFAAQDLLTASGTVLSLMRGDGVPALRGSHAKISSVSKYIFTWSPVFRMLMLRGSERQPSRPQKSQGSNHGHILRIKVSDLPANPMPSYVQVARGPAGWGWLPYSFAPQWKVCHLPLGCAAGGCWEITMRITPPLEVSRWTPDDPCNHGW